jgi:predicted phage terminase large subunit-like protein
LLVLDDMLKDQAEARSEVTTRGLHLWFEHVARTRLSRRGAIICVGTRWGERDLIGYVLREHKDENWLVLNLPAIAETEEFFGGKLFRHAGEALWPEQFPLEMLQAIRQDGGAGMFTALYQGRPLPEGGLVFNVKNFNRIDMGALRFRRTCFALDTAFKTGRTSDYSVILVAGEIEQGYPIAHLWRGRVDFPTLRRTLVSLAGHWHPNTILIEDAASGQSLIQDLKQTNLPIVPVRVDADKLARATAITGLVESGRVFLPVEAGWLTDFLNEVAAFPGGAHDDQVDALTMALNYLRGGIDQRAWFRAVAVSQGRSEAEIREIERRLPATGLAKTKGGRLPEADDDKEEIV